jgi:menaquinone-dependent protoporphyrinogen IX oxidase
MRIVSTPFCIVTDKCSILSLRPSYPSVYRRCWSGQERKRKSTGWRPRKTLLLGGALRFTEYDYFQEQIVNSTS